MKPVILLHISRGVTSKYVVSLIQQLAFLREYQDKYDIIFMTLAKTPKATKYIEKVAGIRITKTLYTNHLTSRDYHTWELFADEHAEILCGLNIHHVIIFGNALSSASGIKRDKNALNTVYRKHTFMKFNAIDTILKPLYIISRFLEVNPKVILHEFLYDHQENLLSQCDWVPNESHQYHGYTSKRYGFKRIDTLQYYLKMRRENVTSLFYEEGLMAQAKTIDITFGMTVLTKDRNTQIDSIKEKLKDYNSKIFIKNNFTGEDTFVTRDVYMDLLSRSRFTLIVPPYEADCFSPFRFIESLENDCLPLVMDDVDYSEFIESFNLDIDIFKKSIRSYDNIYLMSEEYRLPLLSYFKEKVLNGPMLLYTFNKMNEILDDEKD